MRICLLLSVSLLSAETARYRLAGTAVPRATVVTEFVLTRTGALTALEATKTDGSRFRVWLEGERGRYVFQEGTAQPREYRNAVTGEAVIPAHGAWEHLLPRPAFAAEVRLLGHRYARVEGAAEPVAPPADPRVVLLRPDLLIGPASNTRQKDETRRYDESDYELIRLTARDYREMRDAGITCVRVDDEQSQWADELGLFYWGAGKRLPFPESLYRSQYLGAALFLDEPAVGTRDHVLRPRLAKDPAFRKAITPQIAFEEFRKYYDHAWRDGAATAMMRGLRERADVDLGDMNFRQANLYSWETMPSTALHQLSQDARVPEAMVFEPPGRIGTRRTLPEFDMTYGVQIRPDDPAALTAILFGFLRGAARSTGKSWGVSIYGAVERADAPFWLTHAYDMGATRFFFWDNYQLACVPYGEVLGLARILSAHAAAHPRRNLDRLRQAAELAIVLPPGYDLGHVQTGKGSLWGIDELNLERVSRAGVRHRAVMSAFFTEIERALKLGIAFDTMWDLPAAKLAGYREMVRVREDGKVEVSAGAGRVVLDRARVPVRAMGAGPGLTVSVEATASEIRARGVVVERGAPVFYTLGADTEGVYRNAMVMWELFGPGEEDRQSFRPDKLKPVARETATGGEVEARFPISRPGTYRLRAATVDTVGRSTVVWKTVVVR